MCPLIRSFSAFDLVLVFENRPFIFPNVGVILLCFINVFLIKATLDDDLCSLDIVFVNLL